MGYNSGLKVEVNLKIKCWFQVGFQILRALTCLSDLMMQVYEGLELICQSFD